VRPGPEGAPRANRARRLLIGLGNELRGDDAAGLLVARAANAPAAVEVLEVQGEPLDLVGLWEGAELAVVVDAAAPAGEPGRVHRFELGDEPLPAALGGPSTHALGLAEAVELARSLDRLPSRLVVLAIEGERFDLGAEPSAAVRQGVTAAADAALAELGD
jgi:hydrogenase maturation protease